MEEGKKTGKDGSGLPASVTTGAIALIFLIIGYQVALFVHKAAVARVVANRDRPDTVYVVDRDLAASLLAELPPEERRNRAEEVPGPVTVKKAARHAPEAIQMREKAAPRSIESFRFDPNTVSVEDLRRLGFSEGQAASIDRYRQKGGRFRRKEDFAKSYVVADSVYARLEPYIQIPKIDINRADSAAFTALPGIGPYFAGKMVSYRTALGGYSTPEQLMDLYRFDREKYDGLRDLVTCSPPAPYPLWTLSEAELRQHPYIRGAARGIVLYRDHRPVSAWTLEGLRKAGVLTEEQTDRLSRCRIAAP
ncbi:MAG: helix-hairpin-helix domain-containing protein [Bacteroidales bacterium]|nr:helix-hairpin-helix domain-containing protein [Bacteroidales bacterium]